MLHAVPWFRRSVFVLLAVCAPGAAGQAPESVRVRLQGVVVDAATLAPVDSATVTLVGSSASITTERFGRFELDVPSGPIALHVTAPGHSSVIVDTEVHADRPAFVRVPLPTFAVTLSELLVQASGDDEPRRRQARTAAELVAQELPRAGVNSGQVGQNDFDLNLRLATSFGGSEAPTIVVDGVVLSRGAAAFEALDRIPAADVEDVQVLRGPSAAFLYPFAANGVIVVTTKRGQAR
jgi:outer membrane receptor protein involved in Fe transport